MIDTSRMLPVNRINSTTADQSIEMQRLVIEARSFFDDQSRCLPVAGMHLAWGFAKVALFLVSFSDEMGLDSQVWVVVGDVPPAILNGEICPNALEAFEGYVGELQAWIDAVRAGTPIHDLMPLIDPERKQSIPPTSENADLVERRVRFIESNIMGPFMEQLQLSQYLKDEEQQDSMIQD